MELYLVRHATAIDRVGGNVKRDEDRFLIDVGRDEAEAMAKALRTMGVKGDAFLASPLVRTRQTAEIFAEILADKSKVQLCEALAPTGNTDDLYQEIARLKHAEQVFLFGHMPDICVLAGTLLYAGDLEIPFKKASVCRIDLYSMPPSEPGTLKWFLTPKIVHSLHR